MLKGLITCNETCVLPLEKATETSSFPLYTLLCLHYKISSVGDCVTRAGMVSCRNP